MLQMLPAGNTGCHVASLLAMTVCWWLAALFFTASQIATLYQRALSERPYRHILNYAPPPVGAIIDRPAVEITDNNSFSANTYRNPSCITKKLPWQMPWEQIFCYSSVVSSVTSLGSLERSHSQTRDTMMPMIRPVWGLVMARTPPMRPATPRWTLFLHRPNAT